MAEIETRVHKTAQVGSLRMEVILRGKQIERLNVSHVIISSMGSETHEHISFSEQEVLELEDFIQESIHGAYEERTDG